MLEAVGVVHRIVTNGDHAAYELTEDLTEHHHHLICSRCGSVEDVPASARLEQSVARAASEIARRTGFRTQSTASISSASANGAPDPTRRLGVPRRMITNTPMPITSTPAAMPAMIPVDDRRRLLCRRRVWARSRSSSPGGRGALLRVARIEGQHRRGELAVLAGFDPPERLAVHAHLDRLELDRLLVDPIRTDASWNSPSPTTPPGPDHGPDRSDPGCLSTSAVQPSTTPRTAASSGVAGKSNCTEVNAPRNIRSGTKNA